MYEIDEVDRKIIQALQKDGRASNVEIARHVCMTEGTVRKRVERLVSSHVIRIAALPEPTSIGFSTHTLISLQVEPAAFNQAIEQIVHAPPVRSVLHVTGESDLMVEAVFPDDEGLRRFLQEEMGHIPGISKMSVSHVLQVVKSPCDWKIPSGHAAEILVADDDPDFVEFCRTVLEDAGYQVDVASNGDKALASMRSSKPDLVLLDVMMQGILDGLHASRCIREDPDLAQTPVIMISSIAESPYAGMFPVDQYVPINCFLTKPIDPRRLVLEVRRQLDRL